MSGRSPGSVSWEDYDSAGTENGGNLGTDKGLCWGGAPTLGRCRDNREVGLTPCKENSCYSALSDSGKCRLMEKRAPESVQTGACMKSPKELEET